MLKLFPAARFQRPPALVHLPPPHPTMTISACARSRALLTVLACLAPVSAGLGQDVIVHYPFNIANDFSNRAAHPSVTATNIVRPAGGGVSGSTFNLFKTTAATNVIPVPQSLEAAFLIDHYFGFTVTPANHEVSYQAVSFKFGVTNNTGSVNPHTGYWALYTDATGLTGTPLAAGEFSMGPQTGLAPIYQDPSPSLSLALQAALQDTTDPVEFRIYFWNNTTVQNSNLVIRFDDIMISANTVELEPPVTAIAPDVIVQLTGEGLLQLTWDGQAGLTYSLESSTSPAPASFIATGDSFVATTDEPINAFISATGERLFARVVTSVTPQ